MSKYDNMVEDMEANEDMVECKECFDLFPKASCMKYPHGYICPTCGKNREVTSTDITTDLYSHDFPDVADYDPDSIKPAYKYDADDMFDSLIADELEAIDHYDRAATAVETSEVENKKEVLDTLDHIKDEEEEHIDELKDLQYEDDKEPLEEAGLSTVLDIAGYNGTEDDFLAGEGIDDGAFFDDFDTRAEQDREDPLTRPYYMRRVHNSRLSNSRNRLNFEDLQEAAATFKYNDSEETPVDKPEGDPKTEELQEACKWTCYYDGKEVGTVEASTEEEAADKMQKEYPEYHYGAYDGCFEVCKEGLTEAALDEYVIDRTVKRVGAGIKRGLEYLQGKDAAKILNSFFTKGFFIYVMEHDDFKLSDMEKAHKDLHNKPSNPFKDYTKAFTTAGRISKLYETKVFLFANVLTQDAIAKSEFGKTLATRYGSKATEIDDGEDVGKTMPGIQLAVFEDGRALLNPGNKLATNLATARDEKKALDKSAKKATAGGSGTARNYGNGPEKKNPSGPKEPPLQVMYDTLANTKKLSETQLATLKLALMKKNEEGYDEAKTKAAAKALRGLYKGYIACGDDQKKRDEFMSDLAGKSTATDMAKAADEIVSEVEKKSGEQPQEQPEEQSEKVNASYYDDMPEDDIEFVSEEFEDEEELTEAGAQGNYQVDHKDMKTPDEWFDTLDAAVDYINQGIKDKKAKSFALYDRTNGRNLMIWIDAMKEDRDGRDEFLGYFVSQHEDKSLSFANGVLSASTVNLNDKRDEFKKLLGPGVDRYANRYTWKHSPTGHTYVDERELIVYYEPSESEAETKKVLADAWAKHPANRNSR